MNKRILITGSQGFTGHYLKKEFLEQGWEVYGLDAVENANDENYRQIDLMDNEGLESYIRKINPHAVAHLAGIAFVAHKSAIDFYNTHVLGTLNLLNAIANNASSIQKVLLASSATVYGNSIPGMYSESTPLKPANDYSVSKLAMEYMAWLWREKLPIVITRPFNYTGVGQNINFLIPKIVSHYQQNKKVIELGNINVKRDFSDVRSTSYAYRKLIEADDSRGAVNVCAGVEYSVQEALDMMEDIAGYKIKILINQDFVRKNEVSSLYGNCDLLRKYIGEYQSIDLKETLKWMWENNIK